MKILIDGSPIFRNRSGVGQYVYRLLDKLFSIDNTNRYYIFGFLFVGKKFQKPYKKLPKNVSYKLVRLLPSKIHNVVSRRIAVPPIDLLTGIRPDISIFTNFVRTPLPLGSKSITFVYDLSFISHAQYSNDKNSKLLQKQVPKSVHKSDKIITISENSKKEIMDYYGVDSRKIEIIHPALDHDIYYPRNKQEQAKVKKKLNIDDKYILYTGTIEPRKNIVGIIRAYVALPESIRSSYQLVLAGGKGWKDEEIQRELTKNKNENIRLTGYVDDTDLPALYSGAYLFVFPTFYEGWGMPPLESMACGVPVITSNNSSLPEVVGDAGVMIDAEDTLGLTKQMNTLLTDKELYARLKSAGFKQAGKFSWEKSAQKFKEVIETL